MTRSRWRSVAAAVAVVAAVVVVLLQAGGDDGEVLSPTTTITTITTTGTATTATAATTNTAAAPTTAVGTATVDTAATGTAVPAASTRTTLAAGLELVALATLPEEAAETWALVQSGGPFPYDRDGVVFENRERLLPRRDRGDYREYTVPTLGEGDRGARRLVVSDEAVFYTADHYDSFVQVDVDR
ncbi:MAG: ribonuclease domain-containing protein [Acidimicrobiales bacterium]